MLTGRYRTSALAAKYCKNESDTCKLCRGNREDILHLLITCPTLERHRSGKINHISEIYTKESLPPPVTDTEICSALLNGDAYIRTVRQGNMKDIEGLLTIRLERKDNINSANLQSNLYCAKMAKERELLINNCSGDVGSILKYYGNITCNGYLPNVVF